MKASRPRRYRIRGGGVFLGLLSVALLSVGFGAYCIEGGVSARVETTAEFAAVSSFLSLDKDSGHPDGFEAFSYSDYGFLSNGRFVSTGELRYYLLFDPGMSLEAGDGVSFLLRLNGVPLSALDVLDEVSLDAGGTFSNSLEEGSLRSDWTSPGPLPSRNVQLSYTFNSSLLTLLPDTGVSFYLEATLL